MMLNKKGLVAALALGGSMLLVAGCAGGGDTGGGDAGGGDPIKIGVLATSEGNLAFGMDEAKAAIAVALGARDGDVDGATIAGKTVEIIYAGTDGTTASAQTQVKKLVESDGVDIVFGPVSGDEGETIVQYALTVPEVTFVNGSASPVGMTLEGAENFFRFHGDSAMWMGGVGDYAVNDKGYEKVYLLAEDYSFPYDNAGGFFQEFCAAGGEINGASWVPVGTTDYATIIAQIPADTDAVYVGLGGADAASFLSQAVTNGVTKPLIGGTIAVDTTALSGDANIASAAVGMISGGPVPGAGFSNPVWDDFVAAYATQPNAFPSPSIFALLYYNSFESLLLSLEAAEGDLSDDQAALRDELSNLSWDSPTGKITMDANRQAIVDNYMNEVVQADDGSLVLETITTTNGVKQGTTVYDRFETCGDIE
mgnify:FL=1